MHNSLRNLVHLTTDSWYRQCVETIDALDYFEIVSLISLIKDNKEYTDIMKLLITESKEILTNQDIIKYSESAYLLFDLVSCPYLTESDKIMLINTCYQYVDNIKTDTAETKKVVKYIEKHSWYFNWNQEISLEKLLKKKEYMLSY